MQFMQTVKLVRLVNAGTIATTTLPTVSNRLCAARPIAGFGTLLWYAELVTAGSFSFSLREAMNVPLSTGNDGGVVLVTTGTVTTAAQATASFALPTAPWLAPTFSSATGPITCEISAMFPMNSFQPAKYLYSMLVKPTPDSVGTFANALINAEAYPFVPKTLRNCAGMIYLRGNRTAAEAALYAADAAGSIVPGTSVLQTLPYTTNVATCARMRVRTDSGTYPANQMQTIAFQLFGTDDWINWSPTGAFYYLPGGAPTSHAQGLINADALTLGSSPWVDITPYQGLAVVAAAPATLGAVTGSLRTYVTLDFAL